MLTKMGIQNFKSFKNFTSIDFKSTNYKILNTTNVNHNGILKGAIFVGGNATGKTNIITALKLLLDLLFREKFINMGVYKCLFGKSSNIILNYEFNIENNIINYNIEYDTKKKFMVEKLLLNNESILERIGQSGRSKITDNQIHENLDNQTLLLRTIYFNTKFNKFPILISWFDYLLNSIYLDAALRARLHNTNDYLDIREYLDRNGENEINGFFKKYNFEQVIEYSKKSVGDITSIEVEDNKDIFFKRQGVGEPIPYLLESLGNKNLLNMLPSFFYVIKNGGMLIIDEFSSAFHNELEELLVRYFMQSSKNAQIFIVSHSSNLLSNTVFRPDQEYAVEFNGNEGSFINRFSNEKPREAQNIEKMYLNGIFGGMPVYDNE